MVKKEESGELTGCMLTQSLPEGSRAVQDTVTDPPGETLVGITLSDGCVKVTVMVLAASIVMLQVPVPVHAPLQPIRVEPASAAAVRVTVPP